LTFRSQLRTVKPFTTSQSIHLNERLRGLDHEADEVFGRVFPIGRSRYRHKAPQSIFLLALSFIALMSSSPLYGQAAGSFSGNVVDKSGSSVPGADVTVVSQATGLTRASKTDSAGHYLVPLLPVGTYTVRVDAAGFQSAASKDLCSSGPGSPRTRFFALTRHGKHHGGRHR
jgi:hypothetical protein